MTIQKIITFLPIILMLASCSTPPSNVSFDTNTDEFLLPPNFSIQAIAAEPLLESPVAISFDASGRIWVVELPGYMRDIDGSEEQKADGKIVVLTDSNADGVMDKRQVVLDELVAPRTLLHAYGGLLYSNDASLWWAELEGTEIKRKVLVDSLYVVGGNIEHQPNSLHYHLDNWIYSANATVRYRYKNGEWLKEATLFRGQWGISSDIDGYLYYNNNSLPIATDYAMPNQLIHNPYYKPQYSYSQAIATSNQLYAYQATAVNRGYQEGVLDEEGKITSFTSACSPLVFTGDLLGEDFYRNAFVCAPEANLLKRYVLEEKAGRKQAVPAYENTEFLISKDETFRPISLYNAPDGSLYVLDLRKGVIQHRAYMTSYLREKILEKRLDTINGKGRIYRVASFNHPLTPSNDYSNLEPMELVKLLASSSAYERKYAQYELVTQQTLEVKDVIETIALDGQNPLGQIHALWTLEGMKSLEEKIWEQATQKTTAPLVHETLIRLSALFPEREAKQIAYFEKMAALNNPKINLQLAIRLGQMNVSSSNDLLLQLAKNHGNDAVLSEAIISGIGGKEEKFLEEIGAFTDADSLKNFLATVLENKRTNTIKAPQLPKKLYKDDRTAGFDLYNVHCASCHGLDGIGKENLAPPLLNSEYVGGSTDRLILLTLNGIKGPVTVNGKRYEMNAVMPGVKNNPALSDKDIADLLIFLRNSFSFSDTYVSEEDVAKWRVATKDRKDLFTEEELNQFMD